MPDMTDILTAHSARHAAPPYIVCSCDQRMRRADTHAAHVAAALETAGYGDLAAARTEAIGDAAGYIERIHPAGLTPRNAVLADLAVVESRMMRGLRANGNHRTVTAWKKEA